VKNVTIGCDIFFLFGEHVKNRRNAAMNNWDSWSSQQVENDLATHRYIGEVPHRKWIFVDTDKC